MTRPDDIGLEQQLLGTLTDEQRSEELLTGLEALRLNWARGGATFDELATLLDAATAETERSVLAGLVHERGLQAEREAVIAPFKRWASSCGHLRPQYAILDSETTDLANRGGEIIELAIIDMAGKVLFNERIKPKCSIAPDAAEIHGITDADLKGLPGMAYWWPKVRRLISQYDILVYNKEFDFQALYNSLNAALPEWYKGVEGASDPYSADHWVKEMARKKAECVMEAYAPVAGNWHPYWGNYSWARLRDACAARGVDTSDLKAHSALDDARATLRLIQATAQLTPEQLPWIGREDEQ